MEGPRVEGGTVPGEASGPFFLRVATLEDAPVLRALIRESVLALQRDDYSPEQLQVAVNTVFTLDTQLVQDGTYFVIEARGNGVATTIVACGGWSARKTLCGGDHHAVRDDAILDPATEAAKVRAFFVHPEWARRGLGTRLLAECEWAAREAGFRRVEMAATLTGVPLYRARGYAVIEEMDVPLCGELRLAVVRMGKKLA